MIRCADVPNKVAGESTYIELDLMINVHKFARIASMMKLDFV